MLSFKTKFEHKPEISRAERLSTLWGIMKEIYCFHQITDERKDYLRKIIGKYGYLPYSQLRALEELNAADTFYGLEQIWKNNGVFDGEKFVFEHASAVARAKVENSDWIKREQHNIKLVNLAALGNGNYSLSPGNFIDKLKQILILPQGNPKAGVFADTIYLVPFHNRDFGCAYLPTDSDVSKNVEDGWLKEKLNLDGKEQVKLFVDFAGLAGHPVIYDVLPQTSRFSKAVLTSPESFRWFDVNSLIKSIEKEIDVQVERLAKKYDEEDAKIIGNVAKNALVCGSDDVGEHFKKMYAELTELLVPAKKKLSDKMTTKSSQDAIHARVRAIIEGIEGKMPSCEEEVTKQGQITRELIENNLWPAPGGAWCSAGVPVFDKMAECGDYPTFKHYNFKGEDVTEFANLDCQTPYYFVYLENGKYNKHAEEFFINSVKNLCDFYNFDGIRVDHIDHVCDEFSQKGSRPISYRTPAKVLKHLNKTLKKDKPYFASLAEYMLGGNYLKEYHKDMKFDILWGNDIISQNTKDPHEIIRNNTDLAHYNGKNDHGLSVLKTYNNQDGEFREINQYPGQLGEAGALFKWFKMKFLPGGKGANRPVLYVDGDESFTKTGTEAAIVSEISLPRAKNRGFFDKFTAINRFAANNEITLNGRAKIITQNEKGFSCWIIEPESGEKALLVAANYRSPFERVCEDGKTMLKEGAVVYDESIRISDDYRVVSEVVYDDGIKDFKTVNCPETSEKYLCFDKLDPGEFRIFNLCKH